MVNKHLLEELAIYPNVWVDLVTSSRTRRSYEKEQFAERITIYKVPVDNKNIHHSANIELLRYTLRGFFFCRKLLRQHHYDVSFAYAGVPAGGISFALKMLYRLPYLVSLQGPDVPYFESRYNYLYPVLTPFIKWIWKHAGVVTAISNMHQRLARSTMPGLEVPIIVNGVDTRIFFPPPNSSARREINIICVGRLIMRKGQHHLLRSFAQLRLSTHCPLRLTLAGTGDADAMLRSLADQLGLRDTVTFAGYVSRDDVPAIYRTADIFVLPSEFEGMSIALLEAMASGLPVVVTPTGGTEELVEEGKNGFIVPWAEVDTLAAVLHRLATDSELRERMGQHSRETALRFSWPTITREYLALCERIAGTSFRKHHQ